MSMKDSVKDLVMEVGLRLREHLTFRNGGETKAVQEAKQRDKEERLVSQSSREKSA